MERGEEEWNRFRSCTAQEELEKGREEKGSRLIFWGKHKVGVRVSIIMKKYTTTFLTNTLHVGTGSRSQ